MVLHKYAINVLIGLFIYFIFVGYKQVIRHYFDLFY